MFKKERDVLLKRSKKKSRTNKLIRRDMFKNEPNWLWVINIKSNKTKNTPKSVGVSANHKKSVGFNVKKHKATRNTNIYTSPRLMTNIWTKKLIFLMIKWNINGLVSPLPTRKEVHRQGTVRVRTLMTTLSHTLSEAKRSTRFESYFSA